MPFPLTCPLPVFQENKTHLQHSLFESSQLLPRKYQRLLRESWAFSFRHDLFARIDERPFAVLYSEEASRPNAPVNVLVAAEILKAGFHWSDRELHRQMIFNIEVRYALGIDDLASEVPELRTLYNFRRRICDYADESGRNLFQEAQIQVTDEQLEALELKTEWQRVDSTQLLSNLAQISRLELVISVLQKLWKSLDAAAQEAWKEQVERYVARRPHQVCYGIAAAEANEHLRNIGEVLLAWSQEPGLIDDEDAQELLNRLLHEQFEVVTEADPDRGSSDPSGGGPTLRLRSRQEISSQSLQSPHDPEATYRFKAGEAYRGGYVANVSETCDPENQLQLITDVQVAPNSTDDAELLERSLDSQTTRGVAVERVTTDGGYTGPVAEAACARHEVELRATRMRGGESRSDRLGWESYQWSFNEQGEPTAVRCPQGKVAALKRGRGDRYIARFQKGACDGCPFFNKGCRVQRRARNQSFSLTRRAIEVAVSRQRLRPEDKPMRAPVEATIRSVKHPFRSGKLPVRGLVRATITVCASMLMVNLRRIHEYRRRSRASGLLDRIIWQPWRSYAAAIFLWRPIRSSPIESRQKLAMP